MREIISDGNELVAKAAIEVGCRFFWGLSYYAKLGYYACDERGFTQMRRPFYPNGR